jgi:hypothetical protein
MSKGKRPKFYGGNVPVLTVREQPQDISSVSCAPNRQECWEFNLVNTKPEAATVEIGEPVFGSISDGRIAVISAIGLLGFAPTEITQQITKTAAQSNSNNLQGIVTKKGEKANVRVKLCLG